MVHNQDLYTALAFFHFEPELLLQHSRRQGGELAAYYEMIAAVMPPRIRGRPIRFANAAGRLLVRRHPMRLRQEFSKADRGGRILVDTGRNAYHATVAAAYSVRAKPGAPGSAPCMWDEIKNGAAPRSFSLRGMADRVSTAGGLWSEMLMRGQALKPAIERLRRLQ